MSIIDLGAIRASDRHIIQLRSYDPYPTSGPKYYRFTADNPWKASTFYNVGDWVIYYPAGIHFNNFWDARNNVPYLVNGSADPAGTFYVVNAVGSVDFGSGKISFEMGDIVTYDGSVWSKITGKSVTRICNTKHKSDLTYDPTYWDSNNIPPYYELDSNSGALYADLPYLPFYSKTYIFTVRIDKVSIIDDLVGFVNQQFKLVIKGQANNPIRFVTDSNLGSLNLGYLSELAILAVHETGNLSINYSIVDGQLPPGLSLGVDGSIIGRIDYSAELGQYNFTVRATDLYDQIIEKDFYLVVVKYDNFKYTQVYVKPFLLSESRYDYSIFITDPRIFEPKKIYRPADPNFGVQQNIKMYLEYGIQQVRLVDYLQAMIQCFTKKKVFFGSVKTVPAKDDYGKHLYDIVYVDIVDPLVQEDGDFVESTTKSQRLIYPNSISNMRRALELIGYDSQIIKTDEYQLPKWMRTPQSGSGLPLGYKTAVVLCYALPNKGASIVKNIKNSGFDFKNIHFEIDRLIIENNLTVDGVRYIPFLGTASTQIDIREFEKEIITSFVLGDSTHYITDATQDRLPILY